MEAKDLNESSTSQEVFSFVVGHLRKQGRRAIVRNRSCTGNECRYLSPEGDKCAVGCLILPEEYYPAMEGHAIFYLSSGVSERLRRLFKKHYELLVELQIIHDENQPQTWEEVVAMMADRWNLKVPA